jgi:hypothetical protein
MELPRRFVALQGLRMRRVASAPGLSRDMGSEGRAVEKRRDEIIRFSVHGMPKEAAWSSADVW